MRSLCNFFTQLFLGSPGSPDVYARTYHNDHGKERNYCYKCFLVFHVIPFFDLFTGPKQATTSKGNVANVKEKIKSCFTLLMFTLIVILYVNVIMIKQLCAESGM